MVTQKSRLNVTLDDKEREMIQEIASRRGLSLARVVGQLIREEYERNYCPFKQTAKFNNV